MSWYGNYKIKYNGKDVEKFSRLAKLVIPNYGVRFDKNQAKDVDDLFPYGQNDELSIFDKLFGGENAKQKAASLLGLSTGKEEEQANILVSNRSLSWYSAEEDIKEMLSYLNDGDSVEIEIDGESHPYVMKSAADKNGLKYRSKNPGDMDIENYSYNYKSKFFKLEKPADKTRPDDLDNDYGYSFVRRNNKRVYTEFFDTTVSLNKDGSVDLVLEKLVAYNNRSSKLYKFESIEEYKKFYKSCNSSTKYEFDCSYFPPHVLPAANEFKIGAPVKTYYKVEHTLKADVEVMLDKELVTLKKANGKITTENQYPDDERRKGYFLGGFIDLSNNDDECNYDQLMQLWATAVADNDEMLKIACNYIKKLLKQNSDEYTKMIDSQKGIEKQQMLDRLNELKNATKSPAELNYYLKSFSNEASFGV